MNKHDNGIQTPQRNSTKKKHNKTILKGMTLLELEKWCLQNKQPQFRGIQIYEWMYNHGESNPESMSNLGENFRGFIKKECILSLITLEKESRSQNESTIKYLFRLQDGKLIETVSMIDNNRHTVCLSSQVGCNVGCTFCATASMGFIRNLTAGEIIDQVEYVRKNVNTPITNIVFMGMGEPMLNYNNVIKASDIFHNPSGYGMSSSRITISTAGVLPKIKQFIKEKVKYKLAISLNASTDAIRKEIMPINNTWGLDEIMAVCRLLTQKKRKRIMFEYVLIKDINDTPEDARNLIKLLKNINCKLNIIPFNETDGKYKRPTDTIINAFIKILFDNQKKDGYRTLVRWSKGQDINAGCGQLVALTK